MRTIAAFGRVYKSGPPLNPLLGRDLRRKNTRRFRFDGSANDKSSALACRRSCRDAARHADITKRNYAAGGARREKRPDLDTQRLQRVASGMQHGQHLGDRIQCGGWVCGQVGEEIEIVDDTEFRRPDGAPLSGTRSPLKARRNAQGPPSRYAPSVLHGLRAESASSKGGVGIRLRRCACIVFHGGEE